MGPAGVEEEPVFSVVSITTAVALLLGVRHSTRLRRVALSPRTPARIASAVTATTVAVFWVGLGAAVLVGLALMPTADALLAAGQ